MGSKRQLPRSERLLEGVNSLSNQYVVKVEAWGRTQSISQMEKREARNGETRLPLRDVNLWTPFPGPDGLRLARLSNCEDTLKPQLPRHCEVECDIRYPKGGGGRVKDPGYGKNVGDRGNYEWVICSQALSEESLDYSNSGYFLLTISVFPER
jgi:hypothetical protein